MVIKCPSRFADTEDHKQFFKSFSSLKTFSLPVIKPGALKSQICKGMKTRGIF